MKNYNPREPLVSLHVPKTGGTSLRLVLETWYGSGLKLHYQDTATLQVPERHAFENSICIHGHFDAARGYGVDDYYPTANQFVVFLRDPFERAISLYFFIRKHHLLSRGRRCWFGQGQIKDDGFMPFERWIPFLLDEQASGRSTASPWYFPRAPDAAAIRGEMSSRFVFVGLSETYEESLHALGHILGKPPAKQRFVNQTKRTQEDFARWRSDHETAFPDEYEIYETGRSLNRESLRAFQHQLPGGSRAIGWSRHARRDKSSPSQPS